MADEWFPLLFVDILSIVFFILTCLQLCDSSEIAQIGNLYFVHDPLFVNTLFFLDIKRSENEAKMGDIMNIVFSPEDSSENLILLATSSRPLIS